MSLKQQPSDLTPPDQKRQTEKRVNRCFSCTIYESFPFSGLLFGGATFDRFGSRSGRQILTARSAFFDAIINKQRRQDTFTLRY